VCRSFESTTKRFELNIGRLAPEQARQAVTSLSDLFEGKIEDIRLLTSELVTNSIRHADLSAQDSVSLIVKTEHSTVRVEVIDTGKGFDPNQLPEPTEKDFGRGLAIIDALAKRWGVEQGVATRVWFELDTALSDPPPSY
jgi:anti-sigma regulatory factor (Ser/Thr protein kinase)